MEFIVVTGPTYNSAINRIKKALTLKDGIELRLDLFRNYTLEDVKAIIDLCHSENKQIICTLRSSKAGGGYRRSILSLEKEIYNLSTLCPDYLDVQWDLSDELFDSLEGTKVIVSYHDFQKTAHNLETILQRMKKKKGFAYKLCTTANLLSDAYRMLNLILKEKKENSPFIGLCMGAKGKVTREDGLKVGNYLNYKIMHLGDKVASGLDFA